MGTTRVHGHAVLTIMLEARRPLSRSEIVAEARRQFGEDACYYTCSADNMNIEELIEFLMRRSKITESGGLLTAYRERMCTHE